MRRRPLVAGSLENAGPRGRPASPFAADEVLTLLAMLHTVAGQAERAPQPWTGSWTEPSVQAVQSGPPAA
jgi:hypothetical protein